MESFPSSSDTSVSKPIHGGRGISVSRFPAIRIHFLQVGIFTEAYRLKGVLNA
ncbi:MAG: hypothetical protein QXO47_07160 [Thermoproteota archaeon]